MKPTIHLIAPFHTVPTARYSHCAFTGKALRFARMLRMVGYSVVEYANAGSESEANEHVPILTRSVFDSCYPPLGPTEAHGNRATINTIPWRVFHARLVHELKQRIKPGDIVAHPFGRAHEGLVTYFPKAIHVETGIGYPDTPFGAWRIFESEAWRHYHWGRDDEKFAGNNGLNRSYSWVIPNYYDVREWPLTDARSPTPYLLYMNRIDPCKGLLTCADILKAWDAQHPTDGLQIWFAGQGDFSVFEKMAGADLCTKRVRYLGTVTGTDRAPIMSEALAMLMPTNFVEPFGGAGIEGMLCGTPLIASDWGAFTETIREGENGYRCKVLADWIHAIERVGELDHTRIAMEARKRYTLEVCAEKYDRAFHQLSRLFIGKGWDDMGAFEKRDPGPTDPTESLHTQH